MGEQVLGGGVIVLVCVLLWLVYLLPSWASRHRYDASERNAVRINQALRILAETSETPAELRIELNTRAAYEQQKLARRAQAERDDLERRAREEREAAARRALAEREALATRAQTERAELERQTHREREAARVEAARRELAATRALPAARRARARRRARLLTTVFVLAALTLIGTGVALLALTTIAAAQAILWTGVALGVVSVLLARRVARVGAPTVAVAAASVATRSAADVQDLALPSEARAWAPRSLPRPLTASAGSRAAAVLDAEEARAALRLAEREERLRLRAEAQRPPSIDTARRARETAALAGGATASDAAIEAHVRELLARRASGQ